MESYTEAPINGVNWVSKWVSEWVSEKPQNIGFQGMAVGSFLLPFMIVRFLYL